ncbi:MAG TPA: amidohydrolase family protein [Candidatus Dormibacteraeota bacterium]
MRVIALEEHFAAPGISKATAEGEWAARVRELGDRGLRLGTQVIDRLADLDEGRLAAMDAAAIDLQVLSQTQPGVESLPAGAAVPLAREANDFLADAIARHPDRYSGFAVLPTPAPQAAADELDRAVTKLGLKGALINGRTGGSFLDDRSFWPIFERAERLGVPIYLHPGLPPAAIREACYEGLPPAAGHWLSIAAWGWHVDTGLHALRLIAAGVFDRFPKLQVIIGHMGEALPFMLERTNSTLSKRATGLEREVKEYFRENFYVTTSGFFSYPPLQCLLAVADVDRVMFAVDYPYSSNDEGRIFLDGLPVGAADKEKIAHSNAERLLGV